MVKNYNHIYVYDTVPCEGCGSLFKISKHQRYRYKKKLIEDGIRKKLYCSRSCRFNNMQGENNPKWRGGKTTDKSGIYIYYPSHIFATERGYVYEHRLVMEQFLDRYLFPEEVVHHLDGNPLNNDISNLILLSSESEHRKIHVKYRTLNKKGQFHGHKQNVGVYI